MVGTANLRIFFIFAGMNLSADVEGYCVEYLSRYLVFTVPILLMNNFTLYGRHLRAAICRRACKDLKPECRLFEMQQTLFPAKHKQSHNSRHGIARKKWVSRRRRKQGRTLPS